MSQFINFHDIETNSDVIVNRDQIQEIRKKRNKQIDNSEYYEIKFANEKILKVKTLLDQTEPVDIMFDLNKN